MNNIYLFGEPRIASTTNTLQHYGVPGMRWGVRRSSQGKAILSSRKIGKKTKKHMLRNLEYEAYHNKKAKKPGGIDPYSEYGKNLKYAKDAGLSDLGQKKYAYHTTNMNRNMKIGAVTGAGIGYVGGKAISGGFGPFGAVSAVQGAMVGSMAPSAVGEYHLGRSLSTRDKELLDRKNSRQNRNITISNF